MFKELREKIARFIAPDVFNTIVKRAEFSEAKISQRVADIVLQLDPLDLALKKYNIDFLKEYNRPYEDMDGPSQFMMMQWGYQQHNDPSFRKMTEWIANSQGNISFKKGRNREDLLFGQGAVCTMEVLRQEVKTLYNMYEERQRRPGEFDGTKVVEE
jgi:hypothetical protein